MCRIAFTCYHLFLWSGYFCLHDWSMQITPRDVRGCSSDARSLIYVVVSDCPNNFPSGEDALVAIDAALNPTKEKDK